VSERKAKKSKPRVVAQEPLVDPASTNNLVGFFALLLEIDRRNNPNLYKAPKRGQSHA